MARVPAVDPSRPLAPPARAAARFAMTRTGRWLAIEVAARVDPWLLRASRGRVSSFALAPVLLLSVPGRRTGKVRTLPLLYWNDGEDVILVASSFGRDAHPAWYRNVLAHPEVVLTAGGRTGRYVAAEVEEPERAGLFARAQQLYPGYGDYATRAAAAGRRIPVLRLRPLD